MKNVIRVLNLPSVSDIIFKKVNKKNKEENL